MDSAGGKIGQGVNRFLLVLVLVSGILMNDLVCWIGSADVLVGELGRLSGIMRMFGCYLGDCLEERREVPCYLRIPLGRGSSEKAKSDWLMTVALTHQSSKKKLQKI